MLADDRRFFVAQLERLDRVLDRPDPWLQELVRRYRKRLDAAERALAALIQDGA